MPQLATAEHFSSFISLQGLGYRYAGSRENALNDVSLDIAQGSCFGLLGPNGAGKTTLLSILTGTLALQAGEVRLRGKPVANWAELKRAGAIVPQELAFYPTLSGRENLAFFAGLFGLQGKRRAARIEAVSAVCSLGEVMDKQAANYSGGLKRRLNLAIGLLNEPAILYLDEPTVGIDTQSRHFILDAIRELKQGGMTIVYTSHYMEEIQAVCDDVAVIDHGRLIAHSRMDELLAGSDQRLLLVATYFEPSEAQLAALARLGKVERKGLQLRMRLHDTGVPLEQVLKTIAEAGIKVRQIQYGLNQLEDIYLSLTATALRD